MGSSEHRRRNAALSTGIKERAAERKYDAIVVGSGPNGLSAAITIAQAGHSVLVVEAEATIGGGARSGELTLPGFIHDLGSAVHPLGRSSSFFESLPLHEHGLEWIHPDAPLAHPLDNGSAPLMERSIEGTAERLGADGRAYRNLMAPLAEDWRKISPAVLGPPRPPRHPLALTRFAVLAIRPATMLARDLFDGEEARSLFAGIAAHSVSALELPMTSAAALVLGTIGHVSGWPFPRGGAGKIADALAGHLCSLGGEIITHSPVASLEDLPPTRAVLLDVTPRQVVRIAGGRLPGSYRRRLERYRYGPGAFKLDWALDGPIPWTASECLRAGTVHVGGTLTEIAEAERQMARGRIPEQPFVLLAQQTLADPTRAPQGKHTAWAYCHVPNGATVDMTERIERQIERFAPGFRERILARCVTSPAQLERQNANLIGGDIAGGSMDLRQFFARPTLHSVPYATPVPGLYICSSSTPPGGGVHGLCGHLAARAAVRYSLG